MGTSFSTHFMTGPDWQEKFFGQRCQVKILDNAPHPQQSSNLPYKDHLFIYVSVYLYLYKYIYIYMYIYTARWGSIPCMPIAGTASYWPFLGLASFGHLDHGYKDPAACPNSRIRVSSVLGSREATAVRLNDAPTWKS